MLLITYLHFENRYSKINDNIFMKIKIPHFFGLVIFINILSSLVKIYYNTINANFLAIEEIVISIFLPFIFFAFLNHNSLRKRKLSNFLVKSYQKISFSIYLYKILLTFNIFYFKLPPHFKIFLYLILSYPFHFMLQKLMLILT